MAIRWIAGEAGLGKGPTPHAARAGVEHPMEPRCPRLLFFHTPWRPARAALLARLDTLVARLTATHPQEPLPATLAEAGALLAALREVLAADEAQAGALLRWVWGQVGRVAGAEPCLVPRPSPKGCCQGHLPTVALRAGALPGAVAPPWPTGRRCHGRRQVKGSLKACKNCRLPPASAGARRPLPPFTLRCCPVCGSPACGSAWAAA